MRTGENASVGPLTRDFVQMADDVTNRIRRTDQYYLKWVQSELDYNTAVLRGSNPTPVVFQTESPDPYDAADVSIKVFRTSVNCELP